MLRAALPIAALLMVWPAAAQETTDEPAPPLAAPSVQEPAKDPEAPAVAAPQEPAAPAAQEPAEEPAAPTAAPEKKKPLATEAQRSICLLVESAARANGLPVEFFARVIWQESRFRPNAVGPVTRSGQRAQGIAQFMPGTAAERNLLDPMDPVQALPKSAEFLSDLRAEFGNLGLAAAAYNAGPRRVQEWLAGTGGMPSETRNYVSAITGSSVEQWAKAGNDADVKQHGGRDCPTLIALLKREPSRFIAALEQHVVTGVLKPWGSILGADNSRDRVLTRYAALQQRHSTVLAGVDPIILERRRGPLPRYQVRVGAQSRAEADALCNRMHKSGGDCVVLRNPRG